VDAPVKHDDSQHEPGQPAGERAPRAWRLRACLASLGLLLGLLMAELGFRAFPERLGFDIEEARGIQSVLLHGSPIYIPHPYTGYFGKGGPTSGPQGQGRYLPRERTPGVPRIACLGGSTTAWGYPADLRRTLQTMLGRPVEVFNWGVGNWTSAETLVNWLLNAQDTAPDVVVIHHSINDVKARLQTEYATDYSHFRRPYVRPSIDPLLQPLVRVSLLFCALQRGRQDLRSVQSMVGTDARWDGARARELERGQGFARNMRNLVRHARERGAVPVLMTMPQDERKATGRHRETFVHLIEAHNELVRELARQEDVLLVDLQARALALGDARRALFVDQVHMQPDGRRLKAAAVAELLVEHGLLE